MRIVMISPDAPPNPNGGIGTYLDGLFSAMPAGETPVELVATTRNRDPRVSRDGNVTIRRLYAPRRWAQLRGPLRWAALGLEYARLNAAGFVAAARQRGSGGLVVGVHDWMCAPAGLVAHWLLRVPVCYHVHSAETYLGDGAKGAVAAAGRTLNRVMSARADLLIVPTPETAQLIPHLAGRTDIVAIPHGPGKALPPAAPQAAEHARLRRLICERHSLPEDGRVIVFAGRFAPHKGVTEMIDALAHLVEGGENAYLITVGTGLPDLTIDERLAVHARERGVEDRVRFLGRFVDTETLREYLGGADACFFPSSHEAFGFIALEAMALGARVVAGPGFSTTVVGTDGNACFRTGSIDPGELAAALAKACDPDVEPELGRRARHFVETEHSWRLAAERTLAAYGGIAG